MNGNCETETELQGETNGRVEFDTRIEYRHGGPCGATQDIKFMFLEKVERNGDITNVFVCSNLGRFGSIPCQSRSRISVTFLGTSKYDIKLSLDDLALNDSGHYRIRVDMTRISLVKNFYLTIKGIECCVLEMSKVVGLIRQCKDPLLNCYTGTLNPFQSLVYIPSKVMS